MASFTVSFNANGSAFDDGYDGRAEIEAILRTLADRIWNATDDAGLIRDSNGNTVGGWTYERDEE